MQELNLRFYAILEWAFGLIEAIGLPIAIAAWVTVFGGAVLLGLLLRRYSLNREWLPALVVGAAALAAHLLDYLVTLRLSPDLGAEANPIWRIVIDRWGLGPAKLYGLSGKILLSIIAFELYALYLRQRESLFPGWAAGFIDFWRRFGSGPRRRGPIDWRNLANFFSFAFALLGPFFFYVALLNLLYDSEWYLRLPAMPIALIAYLGALVLAYLALTYWAFRKRSE
jgi:hypothetical protein